MSYEVEAKFRIENLPLLLKTLSDAGTSFREPVEEFDRFYRHPVRDFAKTDEGLRVRRRTFRSRPAACFVTYKGPKVDANTKTRREIEVSLDENDWERWDAILQVLGFVPAGDVYKIRRIGECTYREHRFELSVDYLPGLAGTGFAGEYARDSNAVLTDDMRALPEMLVDSGGWFLELELRADESQHQRLAELLLRFAATLPLGTAERRGYFELLQEHAS